MELPKTMMIGKRRYTVVKTKKVSGTRHGAMYPTLRIIKVALYDGKTPRKDADVMETFWHEVTHAILYEMDSLLWDNEEFVTSFSASLNRCVLTSEF